MVSMLKFLCQSPEKYLKNQIYRFSIMDIMKDNKVFTNLNTRKHELDIILREKYPFSNLGSRNLREN